MRKLENKTEKAALDFFVVCDKLRNLIEKIIIDEEKEYPLARYINAGTKHIRELSFHILKMALKI